MSQDTLRFLQLLTQDSADPTATFVPMRKGVPGRPLINQKLSTVAATLDALNRTGNDIYFAVNATDGLGRRAENITHVRACWADYDHGVPARWALEPSLVVESSPGKAQCYWLLCADAGCNRPDMRWHAVNKGIAVATHADLNACDASRILRLPGFANHKYQDKPIAKLLAAARTIYTLPQLEAAWEPVKQHLTDVEASEAAANTLEEAEKRRRFAAWLQHTGSAPKPGTGLRSWLWRKAAAGVRDFALSVPAVAEMLLELDAEDVDLPLLRKIAHDAERYGSRPRGAALLERQVKLM